MKRTIRQAKAFLRECVVLSEAGDDTVLEIRSHFRDRMIERGLFWPDVLNILLGPNRIEDKGVDDHGRQHLWVIGTVMEGEMVRIVCSIDWDTRLITINWD